MPDIASLLASMNIQGINPNASLPVGQSTTYSNNLKDQLEAILGRSQRQAQQDISSSAQVNPITRIVEALAQGIATATSQNPSALLAQQVGDVQNKRFLKEQQARQKADQLDLLGTQVQLQDLQNQQAERRQIAAEQRGEAASIRKEKREEDAALIQFNRQMAGQERLANITYQQNRGLAVLKNQFDLDVLAKNQDYSRGLAEAEAKDRKQAKVADLSLSLITYGTDVETAYSVARKFLNDEKLSPGESKALNRAIAQQQALARASRRGGGSGSGGSSEGISTKQAFGLLQKFAENPMAELADGTVVEVSSLSKSLTGEVMGADGQAVKKYLTPAESVNYAATSVLPAIVGAFSPQQRTPLAKQQGSPDAVYNTAFDQQVQAMKKQGVPAETINKMLADTARQHPELKETLQEVQIRNGLSGAKKFQPAKPSAPPAKNRQQLIQEGASGNPNLVLPANLGGAKNIQEFPTQSKRKLE